MRIPALTVIALSACLTDPLAGENIANLSRYRLPLDNAGQQGGTVSYLVEESRLVEFCGDEDGCEVTAVVSQGDAFAAAHARIFYRNAIWFDDAGNRHADGDANAETMVVATLTIGPWSAICTMSDANDPYGAGDESPNVTAGLVNYLTSGSASCVITFID